MPNNREDPQYPGQPNMPPGQVPIRQSGQNMPRRPYSPQPTPPAAPPPQRQIGQPKQGSLILRALPHKQRNESQHRVAASADAQYNPHSVASAQVVHQHEDTHLEVIDYIAIGVLFFLIVAIFAVMGFILRALFAGNIQLPGAWSIERLLILLLVYAVSVGGGYLWGRYQSNTAAQKENIRLYKELNRLRNENTAMQEQLRAVRSTAPTSPSAPAPVVSPQPVVIPKPTEPSPSIYDVARDPEGYGDREREEYPHEKVYPENGVKFNLRSSWQI